MVTAIDLKKRLAALQPGRIIVDSVRQTSDEIIAWQKEQLFAGKTSTGGFIRPPYAPLTRILKRAKGQPTDRVTLKDTGAFYDAIFVDIGTQVWNIGSTDSKTPLLIERYTERIFGLNKISLAGYASDLRPVLLRNFKKATGL
jgi:hypothetical protein